MLALKAVGEGVLNIPICGEEKLRKSGAQLGISTEEKLDTSWQKKLQIFFLKI